MIFYPTSFNFINDAISDLGASQVNGRPNTSSMIMAICTYIIIMLCFGRLAVYTYQTSGLSIKVILYITIAIGAVLTAFPTDLFNDIHVIGASIMMFSMAFGIMGSLIGASRYVSRFVIVICLFPLLAMTVIYPMFYFGGFDDVQLIQKIAIIILIVSFFVGTWIHSRTLCRSNRKRMCQYN